MEGDTLSTVNQYNHGGIPMLVFGVLSELAVNGGSVIFAFVIVGCVGLVTVHLINGIFVIGFVLIDVLIGDGRVAPQKRQEILPLIYDQILLHRMWKSYMQKSSSKISKSKIR